MNLAPSGRDVASAHSLTEDWQVLGAEIGAAPMLEGDGEGETGGLMLRIKGTEGIPQAKFDDGLSMEALIEVYKGRMDELKKVVELGGIDVGMMEEGVNEGGRRDDEKG